MLLLLKFYDDLKLILTSRNRSEIYWVFIPAKVLKREAVILQEELVAEHREMQIIFIIMVFLEQ